MSSETSCRAVEFLDVAIIGAGFCGLATGAALAMRGVERFAIFEQGPDVGDFWARTYDRLRLHSPWHDLPNDGGLSERFSMYKTRDELQQYFRQYAQRFGLYAHCRFGERVTHVRRTPGAHGAEWAFETSVGRYAARRIAIATAVNRVPVVPPLPGRERYTGRLLHSSAYRNPAIFRGQRVLVVGSGNSGAEIALDLLEGGAAAVSMWVRAPRHFIPGRAMSWAFRLFRAAGALSTKQFDKLHAITVGTPAFERTVKLRDAIPRAFSVDLTAYGIRKPVRGPMEETFTAERIPVFDQGTIRAIRRGRIRVVDGNVDPLVELTPGGVRLGERIEPCDAVILATGFAPGLEEFLDDHAALLGAVRWHRSAPLTDGRCQSRIHPTAFFPGFDPAVNGGHSLGRWGWEVGERIAHQLTANNMGRVA